MTGGVITKRRKTHDRIVRVTLTKISEHLNKVNGFFKLKQIQLKEGEYIN